MSTFIPYIPINQMNKAKYIGVFNVNFILYRNLRHKGLKKCKRLSMIISMMKCMVERNKIGGRRF